MLTIKFNNYTLTYTIYLNKQPYISNIQSLAKARELKAIFSKYHPAK